MEPVTTAENSRRGARAKLTHFDVALMKAMSAGGLSQRQIGRIFDVDHSTVCRAINGVSWFPDASRAISA